MRSKGSRFTLGVWGLRVCSLDVAFVAPTVRNRPQPFVRSPYGRAYGKFCRGGQVWRFPTFRCFVSRGRRGTSCHSDVFCNVLKVVLCGRRNTFATMCGNFRGRHSTLDVSCWMFFYKSHWQGCVKWRQGANSVAGVAFCDMCWKLTEASHETSILRLQNLELGHLFSQLLLRWTASYLSYFFSHSLLGATIPVKTQGFTPESRFTPEFTRSRTVTSLDSSHLPTAIAASVLDMMTTLTMDVRS